MELVIRTNKGVLLTRRNIEPLRGKWHIPGGTVLLNETLEQTVKRVAREELGLRVSIKKILGVIEYHIKDYFGHPIGLVFLVEIISANSIKLDEQASAAKFFKIIPPNTVREQKLFLNKISIKNTKK